MASSRFKPLTPGSDPATGEIPIEAWSYLDQEVLLSSRSSQVCITCHWFRHHAGVNCIPLLTCQLHEGLISHGDHLTHRCTRWTQDLAAQRGWAPEVA
jgi:hypothetical protein